MNIDVHLTRAEAIIRHANPTAQLRFTPSEDWAVEDHEATLWLDGKPTNVSLQIGCGYLGVGRWNEARKVMHHHYDGPSWNAAARSITDLVTQGLAQ